jgi:hypothetical protein
VCVRAPDRGVGNSSHFVLRFRELVFGQAHVCVKLVNFTHHVYKHL